MQDLQVIIHALLNKARAGNVMATRELRGWLDRANDDAGPDDGEAVEWADMTPEQRAAVRAQIERELVELTRQQEPELFPDQ